jgi:hypothetical protein
VQHHFFFGIPSSCFLPLVGLLDTRSRTLQGFWAGRFLSFFERKRASSLLAHDALEPTSCDRKTLGKSQLGSARLAFRSRAPGVSKGLVDWLLIVHSSPHFTRRSGEPGGMPGGRRGPLRRLPVARSDALGKLGPAFGIGAGCVVGVGVGLIGGTCHPALRALKPSLSLIRPSRSCVAAIDLFAKHHKRPATSGVEGRNRQAFFSKSVRCKFFIKI